MVSVIVPVYRDERRLFSCLGALVGQSYPSDRTDLIVVDNGCESLTDVARRFPTVTVLEETTPGSYAARNRGLQAARGAIYAFTDADCVPAPDWLARGVAALERSTEVGVVGGRIEMTEAEPSRVTAFDLYDLVCGLPQRQFVESLRFAATANLFTRRDVVERAGVFTPELKSSGDREWAMRVTDLGYEIVYADDVVVRHRTRHTVREFVRRRRRITGGWWQVRRLLASMDPPRQMEIPSRLADSVDRFRASSSHPLLDGLGGRLRFLAVETMLYGLHVMESARLLLGGQPTRS
jgi:cellulose synthase/poly-beta-1,6-N-acetylglucosamine synthase-like glycosyltransferase